MNTTRLVCKHKGCCKGVPYRYGCAVGTRWMSYVLLTNSMWALPIVANKGEFSSAYGRTFIDPCDWFGDRMSW